MARPYFMFNPVGYASSSVVETIGTFIFTIDSICGSTRFSDEFVHNTATSGLLALIAFFASSMTLTFSRRPTLQTSPRSLPVFAGSMSTAPTILKPLRLATWRTTAAPMGPRPKWITRMGPVVDGMYQLLQLCEQTLIIGDSAVLIGFSGACRDYDQRGTGSSAVTATPFALMPHRQFSKARILVIDDEPMNVDLLRRLLERAGFSRVESTTDPREAATRYIEFRPDLILLDLHMPYMDGLAVMDQLNQIAEATYLPILMMTGDTTPEARRDALSRGAKDF